MVQIRYILHKNKKMAQSFLNYNTGPIGFRNNNPGNLRANNTSWEGKIGEKGGFVVFDDVAWGIRATATNFHSSITRHGTNTLRKYITRYAPPFENDTNAYIKFVSEKTGIDPDETLPNDLESLKKILKAQFQMEIGTKYEALITENDYNEGISRLSSPVASFFKAVGVVYKNNPKKINFSIIAIILGIAGYVYYIKKKKII